MPFPQYRYTGMYSTGLVLCYESQCTLQSRKRNAQRASEPFLPALLRSCSRETRFGSRSEIGRYVCSTPTLICCECADGTYGTRSSAPFGSSRPFLMGLRFTTYIVDLINLTSDTSAFPSRRPSKLTTKP